VKFDALGRAVTQPGFCNSPKLLNS